MTAGVKETVTIKCLDDGCDEDVVLIERYHAGGQGHTARWELKDGEWRSNGVGRFDQGTHHHVFCAAYDAEAHRLAAYESYCCVCEDSTCRNDMQVECEDECVCECDGEHDAGIETPGHEYKVWGRDLPVELKRVVHPGSFIKEVN